MSNIVKKDQELIQCTAVVVPDNVGSVQNLVVNQVTNSDIVDLRISLEDVRLHEMLADAMRRHAAAVTARNEAAQTFHEALDKAPLGGLDDDVAAATAALKVIGVDCTWKVVRSNHNLELGKKTYTVAATSSIGTRTYSSHTSLDVVRELPFTDELAALASAWAVVNDGVNGIEAEAKRVRERLANHGTRRRAAQAILTARILNQTEGGRDLLEQIQRDIDAGLKRIPTTVDHDPRFLTHKSD